MRLVFLGSGAFAVPTLRALAQGPHEIVTVLSQPPRPSGRGRRLATTPVASLAKELGLATLEVEDVNDPAIVEKLRSSDAFLGVVVAFGQKLGREVLASLSGGLINLHASLLPRLRGAAPINWAIIRGEQRTGCSVFRIVERMDAGPVLTTRWTQIKPEETAGELHDRLAGIGVDAVQAALALLENGAGPDGVPQDESQATYAPKLKKSDGNLDFARPAGEAARLICGLAPWPGATVRYESGAGRWERLTLFRARVAEEPGRPDIAPGMIDARRFVAAQGGLVEILEVKPSSGRIMTWQEYVNGRHVAEGDQLAPPDGGGIDATRRNSP